ncbi:cytochrome c oxidase biogenesis protein Cmc1 like-domain-containing protein [Polychytrium aggregatum]|uniref:cytochrome c oxidase biogenesis protein Cmc1 like-domain-containing protein n=1 Tax=Polychytrium aggregatum TaxID=110093 RepID=UPI0022FDE2EC|nr:cytochrome c oxidase biogenesis protein Cmc1 like-domain-containing protein [Polychytrium aggregatum]KAI9190791.1 cytochrome c oxidase biogenesis protein Cmc1 like-domain-containing protein [Polychytrium aggregatum]
MKIVTLNQSEEELAFRQMKKAAMINCDDHVKAFVECSRSGTWSVLFKCQDLNKKMNDCLKQFTTDSHRDRIRDQCLHEKIERYKAEGKLS